MSLKSMNLTKTLCLGLVLVASFAIGMGQADVAEAAYCGISISYDDVGPVKQGETGYVYPDVTLGDCAEIDDPRSYTKVSGPSWVSVSSFNGKVSYDTTGVALGQYTVTVGVTWYCTCSTGSDSDSFTISVC